MDYLIISEQRDKLEISIMKATDLNNFKLRPTLKDPQIAILGKYKSALRAYKQALNIRNLNYKNKLMNPIWNESDLFIYHDKFQISTSNPQAFGDINKFLRES